MCDFSLHNVKSRPAKVGDKLTTHNFSTGTCGFAAPEDSTTAVCILPGTELAFSAEVICASSRLFGWTGAANPHVPVMKLWVVGRSQERSSSAMCDFSPTQRQVTPCNGR